MSIAELTPRPPAAGQTTQIEQARAIAEVQGAIVVAQQVPRSLDRADQEMRRSCSRLTMAERAFFAFPRAGQNVSGPSVHLARELARCWGNIQYGVTELSRDDTAGESQMLAFAWDVEANTRAETKFIVKHQRDKRGGPEKLVDLRDIYENNANAGARRLREQIFAVLPQWFTEEAQRLCRDTLAAGDGRSIEERIGAAVEAWGRVGVTEAMLVERLGAPRVAWTPGNLATLAVLWQTIDRGESTVAVEFEAPAAAGPKVADLAPTPEPAGRAAVPADAPPADRSTGHAGRPIEDVPLPAAEQPGEQPPAEPDREPATPMATGSQQRALGAMFGRLGVKERAERLAITSAMVGRRITSAVYLTRDEAGTLIDTLQANGAAVVAEHRAGAQAVHDADQAAAAAEQPDPGGDVDHGQPSEEDLDAIADAEAEEMATGQLPGTGAGD